MSETPNERGATMLLIAASMFVLLGVAALAIDLGGLRYDVRADQLATDAAATAGVASINPFAGSQADQACQVAWDYLLLNLEDEGATTTAPNCATFAGVCSSPSIARQTTAIADPYSVTITHPVPDSHPLMASQSINADFDGSPCQRLGVELTRIRDYTFGSVLGSDSGTTTVSTVARIGAGVGAGEVVPLLVLEPIACNALYTTGQGKVTVSYFNDSPGFIVVDSDGSKTTNPNRCGNNIYTIESQGTQNGWIRAIPVPAPKNIPSAILSYALSGVPPANPLKSYNPTNLIQGVPAASISDPTEPAESRYRLYPQPIGVSRRITRAPLDWRYNCKTNYPDYPIDVGDPSLGGVEIVDCPNTPAPHIDNLVAARSTGDLTAVGFTRWTSLYTCSVSTAVTVTAGNWWVDCPGGFIINGVNVTFTGGDVVFDGDVDLRSFGSLTVNSAATSDSIAFVRAGGDLLKTSFAAINLNRTFVYLADGTVDLVGGTGGLTWTAPLGGNFEDLALWSEANVLHEIGGQAGNTLTGTFFTPMADPFVLRGQGGQFQTDAQFLSRRLEVAGQAEVRMKPDPDRQTLIPIREVRLIR